MATTYLKAAGSNGVVYTVPSGKIAKVLVNKVQSWVSGSSIYIGDYEKGNTSTSSVSSSKGEAKDLSQPTVGYLTCSPTSAGENQFLKDNHILLAGENISSSGAAIFLTIIEEDI